MENRNGANAPRKPIVNPLDDTPCPKCKDCSENFCYREKVVRDTGRFRRWLGQTLCSFCIREIEEREGVINV